MSLAPGVEVLVWGDGGGDGEVLGRIAEGPASTFRSMPSPLATLLPWVSSVHVRLVRLLALALGPDLSVAGVQVGAFRLRPSPPSLLLQRPVLLREVSPLMVFRSWSRCLFWVYSAWCDGSCVVVILTGGPDFRATLVGCRFPANNNHDTITQLAILIFHFSVVVLFPQNE